MSDARRKYTKSTAALRSMRANLRKARAAPKEQIYRPTEKRQAASRANVQKAIAARKTPAGIAGARLNGAQHGYYTKELSGSFGRMREDPKEFQALQALFEAVFVPQDDEEKEWVRRMAEAAWKRLRLFRAQAVWELRRLKEILEHIEISYPLTPQELHRRAALVYLAFDYYVDYIDRIGTHRMRIQKLINKLILKRSEGAIKFKVGPRQFRARKWLDEYERKMALPLDQYLEEQQKELEKARRAK